MIPLAQYAIYNVLALVQTAEENMSGGVAHMTMINVDIVNVSLREAK